MKILKQILFPLFSLFLIYQTVGLLQILNDQRFGELSFLQAVLGAFVLSLFVTGIFAFIGFAYPTGRLLPKSYYKISNPKRLTTVYDILGLKYFKVLLLITFWGKEKNRKKYFNGTKKGIQNFIFQTQQSEFGHLAAFIVILPLTVFLFWKDYAVMAWSLLVLNILGNLYPIILQRYHRMRIARIVDRLEP